MTDFKQRARGANMTVFFFILAGIIAGVWLGMLSYKNEFSISASAIICEVAVFTFVFIALMIARTKNHLWQVLKYLVAVIGLGASWFIPWGGMIIGIGLAAGMNALLCSIGYKLSPELKIDETIFRLTVWSGGKDPEELRGYVHEAFKEKLPFIRKRLTAAENLLVKGKPEKESAPAVLKSFQKIIREFAPVDEGIDNETGTLPSGKKRGRPRALNAEARGFLGRAYVGLAKALLALEQPGQSTEAYTRAKSYGVYDDTLNALLATSYAAANDHSKEAFQAYISYLKQNRGKAADKEKSKILKALEDICAFTKEELTSSVNNLSREISYAGFDAEQPEPGNEKTKKRLEELITANEAVIEADPDIPWAHYYLGLGRLFSGNPKESLQELETTGKPDAKGYSLPYFFGMTYASNADYDKAIEQFETVEESDLYYADAQFHTGRLILGSLSPSQDIFKVPSYGKKEKAQLKKATSLLDKALTLCQDRPDYCFYAALAYYKTSDYEQTIRLLNFDICKDSPPKEFYYLLALAHHSLKKYSTARESLEQVLKIDSSNQPAFSLMGQIWFAEENWAKAEKDCREAIRLDTTDETARAFLGRALFAQEKYEDTIAELKQIRQTEDNEIIYCLGRSLMKTTAFKEAISYLKQLVDTERSLQISYLLGCAYANIGNIDGDGTSLNKALKWFDKASEAKSPDVRIFRQRANVHLLLGNYAKAHEDIQTFLSKEKPAFSYEMGIYYRATGDKTKAVKELEKVISNDSGDYRALLTLGLIKEEDGDLEAAEQLYNSVLKLNAVPDARTRLGIVYSKTGRYQEAITELSSAGSSNAPEDSLDYYLGKAYAESGSYELAISHWESILKRHPDDKKLRQDISAIHRLQATELFRQEKYEESIGHWETCLQLSDGREKNTAVRKNLAEAYFRMGISYLRQKNGEGNLKSKKALEKAASLNNQPVYKYYMAIACINSGDFTTAIPLLNELNNKEPKNARYRYQLASALVRNGGHEQAIPLLKKIVDEDDSRDYVKANILLAECYRVSGQWVRAAESAKLAVVKER